MFIFMCFGTVLGADKLQVKHMCLPAPISTEVGLVKPVTLGETSPISRSPQNMIPPPLRTASV